jgi:uncharacterized YccA/Bax inhibitor family protein
MSNPAMNPEIFAREATRGGGSPPAWGSPTDELPPDLFDRPRADRARGGSGAPSGPSGPATDPTVMSLNGVLSASAVLMLLVLAAGAFAWSSVTVETTRMENGDVVILSPFPGWVLLTVLGAFGIGLLTAFKPVLARVTGPVYALLMGATAGALSKYYEAAFSGIVLQAIGLTVGVFLLMLVLFATRTIRMTDKLRTVIMVGTGAVALVYLVSIGMNLIFGASMPLIHDSGPLGIVFSLAVVGLAAFNLLVDFDLVERGIEMRAPKYMEWYAAFALMVTLVWLYLELLRLLAKLRER